MIDIIERPSEITPLGGAVPIRVVDSPALKLSLDVRIEGIISGKSRRETSLASIARHLPRIKDRGLVRYFGLHHIVVEMKFPVRQRSNRLAIFAHIRDQHDLRQ